MPYTSLSEQTAALRACRQAWVKLQAQTQCPPDTTLEDWFAKLQSDNERLEKELENARNYVKALNQALKK